METQPSENTSPTKRKKYLLSKRFPSTEIIPELRPLSKVEIH